MDYRALRITICIFMCMFPVHGFLLQGNSSSANSGATVSRTEFYETKQSLQYENNFLQQKLIQVQADNDRNLQLLAKQMQEELAVIQQELNNATQTTSSAEAKYKELEQNFTRLQTQFDDLKAENKELKEKVTRINSESAILKNELLNISNLPAVQDRQNISLFNQGFNKLETEVNKLTASEQARSQDFLALYNMTKVHDAVSTIMFNNLNTSIYKLLIDAKTLDDRTKTLEANVSKMAEQVAITACVKAEQSYRRGEKIVFDDIKVRTGAIDTAAMGRGDFKCLSQGLYQISVNILSITMTASFRITKNDQMISHDYVSNDDHYDNGVIVVAIELNVNDIISVKTERDMTVDADGSCITIVKI